MEPTVSVCVRACNKENVIRQCLDSVIHQRFDGDPEILGNDDAATDDTRRLLIDHKNRHASLFRLDNPAQNEGHTQAFWNVIGAASGQYIAILDGDDYWLDRSKSYSAK